MSDQKMREIRGRITISRYAKKETRQKPQGFETRWYVWITHLYSGVRYFEGEFSWRENPDGYKEMRSGRSIYDSEKTIHPIHSSSFPQNPERGAKIFTDWKFYIAVKELIIEWEDYQAEIAGYVHCNAREDLIHQSDWFEKWSKKIDSENSDVNKSKNSNDAKQLLRFVKSPGLKTTNIKIQKEDLEFFPIELKQCETKLEILEEIVVGKSLQVRREHQLDCEIRPLFDKKQPLPIKYAHITVEIHLQ